LDGGGLGPSNDPGVKRLRRDIRAIRPDDRSQFSVEPDLPEVVGIRKRLEDAAPAAARKIGFALGAVLEAHAQAVVSDHLDRSDVNVLGHVR
ncbi:MAG: hypothetical protein WD067_09785, partial [Gaiellaceae bacterium]